MVLDMCIFRIRCQRLPVQNKIHYATLTLKNCKVGNNTNLYNKYTMVVIIMFLNMVSTVHSKKNV